LKGVKVAYLYALAGFSLLLLNGWRMVLSVFYSPLMRVFGLTAVTPVAAASAVWGLASMLASPIAGRVYDRKGPALALLAASILQAISGLAVWLMRFYPWGSAQWLWYAAAATNGAIASLLMMSVSPMVITLFPSKAGYALAFTQAGNYLIIPRLVTDRLRAPRFPRPLQCLCGFHGCVACNHCGMRGGVQKG